MIIKVLDIPNENIFTTYNETQLEALYKIIQEEYNKDIDAKEKPRHVLFVFDDVGYSGNLKAKENGIISLLACNGRHYLISTICIVQKYTQLSTCFRENATGLICFSCSNKQLDLIEEDHNIKLSKKEFSRIFRDATNDKHSFFTINYSNDADKRYIKNFEKHYNE